MVNLLSCLNKHHPSPQARIRAADVYTPQPKVARKCAVPRDTPQISARD
jgi:hypothetical protein